MMRWLDKSAVSAESPLQLVKVKVPGNTIISSLGRVINVEEWQGEPPTNFPHRTAMSALVDLTKAELPLVLRGWCQADTIRPLGMTQSVGLRSYLHKNKSGNWPAFKGAVIADQIEVLWVPGVGMSNKIRVINKPTHRLSALEIAADCITV